MASGNGSPLAKSESGERPAGNVKDMVSAQEAVNKL